ncbi:MAG: PilZ domain-containing protein [Candidatus Omnitrophica bacterium]|nr:PilZ domain-containing protein [Candidatus Omnitrophota bacterium]
MTPYFDEKPKPNASDRRYLPRWEVKNRVMFHCLDPADLYREAFTRDMSCAGACLESNKEVITNQKVHLKVFLSEDQAFEVDGYVCWSKREKARYSTGVHFTNMTPENQELLLSFAFALDKKKLVEHWFRGWDST